MDKAYEEKKIAHKEKLDLHKNNQKYLVRLSKDLVYNWRIYILILPVIIYYILFHYIPMYGAIISFKNFSPSAGIWGSEWVGFKHFLDFFSSFYFFRLVRNTVLLSIYNLIFGFPAPILLALLLNELRHDKYKRTIQTISYLPHFISIVVIAGIIQDFVKQDGIVTSLISGIIGYDRNLLLRPEYFRTIFVSTEIWQRVGWSSIIYLAALAGIDSEQYEAARIDGASRLQQAWHVTIPGLMPTIMILLILNVGTIMMVGFEKVMLLYNPRTYVVADVISTFVYRRGIQEAQYSYAAAVGLFNSVITCMLVVSANALSRKFTGKSLW